MLISVVTAVRNRAATVGAAIASVQAQTYPDTEHVVQDGGSTDGTLEILRTTADARTRLVSTADDGLYDAINRGIARAKGEAIGLMHSDDAFAGPDILARVAAAFADPDVDAVYGDLDYVSARDPSRIVRRWRSGAFAAPLLARGWMPPHPTLYIRRRVLERQGCGRAVAYDPSFRISADYDAVLRWFGQPGFRAVHVPHVFVRMRLGGASNASLGHILTKSREDYRALRRSGIGRGRLGGLAALACKNAGKLPQFLPPTFKTNQRGTP